MSTVKPFSDPLVYCRASNAAHSLSESANVAYWMQCEGKGRADYHHAKMVEEFRVLANALGFDITERTAVAEIEPAERAA